MYCGFRDGTNGRTTGSFGWKNGEKAEMAGDLRPEHVKSILLFNVTSVTVVILTAVYT